MKICVLRRDGENVHNGMLAVVHPLVKEFFGEREIYIQNSNEAFTQTLMFEIPHYLESKIVPFIMEISSINILYAVRIIK